MQRALLLDVVVGKGASVLELLARKNQTLLVGGDSLLVLDLGLDVVNAVRRLHVERDGFAREGLDEDLYLGNWEGNGEEKVSNVHVCVPRTSHHLHHSSDCSFHLRSMRSLNRRKHRRLQEDTSQNKGRRKKTHPSRPSFSLRHGSSVSHTTRLPSTYLHGCRPLQGLSEASIGALSLDEWT